MRTEQRQSLVGIETEWLKVTGMAILFEFAVTEMGITSGETFDPTSRFHMVIADGISLQDNVFAALEYHNKAGRHFEFFIPKDKILFITWMENLEDASKLGFHLAKQ